MATFTLTMGSDTVAGGPENDTANGTAATLNAGDSLTGGAGTDVLALIGSGTFRVDQLATFTGFERIRLDNATTSYANLMLGSQAIEVDATGSFSIGVNSPSNWNSSNIINGDAQTGSTANLTFYNNQAGYPPLPVTYDLTSNTFSRVNISGWSDNITLLVNNADTADVPFFNGYGQNVKLATSGSTLDLSHTKVSGFSVNSTNTLGTAFTVGDLGTAFQIAGGAGQDTITALGFIFTPDQRNTIFAIASVEKIVDQGGTYLKDATTADTFHGGSGNDIFNVDNAGDVVIEDANAGIDTVNSPNSIAPSRTLGRGSRSKGARREQRLRPRASRSTRLPGAALNAAKPEAAAAAIICFEWLQRPENVLAGYLRWTDYRSKEWPSAIKIEHHKTGAVVWHPLEERTDGGIVKFYEDAEAVLARLPRRGVPMILREFRDGMTKPFSFSGMQKIVHTMRDKIGLPSTFTLDACRHGGMTELEEAELTDGQGRALSAHKSQQAYEGYAKRTMGRALSATRKRHAHRLANTAGTNIQNEPRNGIQNDETAKNKIGAK